MKEILYLWHIISAEGVQVHMEKIRAIRDCPMPNTVTELKGFLGIFTYYRRYVKGFSQFTTPLTDLTKNGAFTWTVLAHKTFEEMKGIMSSCSVLVLPDFSQPFVVECDASGEGLGVVLMKNHHPIAFESRKVKSYECHYSIYDKEMLAILHDLTKFRQYLVGSKFKIKTNHNSLKYFLEQKELNECQQKWVSKVQAYDFKIEYVKGNNNIVVDALSIRTALVSLMSISIDWRSLLLVE